jgi:hypothetical protein
LTYKDSTSAPTVDSWIWDSSDATAKQSTALGKASILTWEKGEYGYSDGRIENTLRSFGEGLFVAWRSRYMPSPAVVVKTPSGKAVKLPVWNETEERAQAAKLAATLVAAKMSTDASATATVLYDTAYGEYQTERAAKIAASVS